MIINLSNRISFYRVYIPGLWGLDNASYDLKMLHYFGPKSLDDGVHNVFFDNWHGQYELNAFYAYAIHVHGLFFWRSLWFCLYYDWQRENVQSVKPVPPPPKEPIFKCPICMGPFVEEMSTKCGHVFCKACIKAAIGAQGKCPTCRRKVTIKDTIRIYLPASDWKRCASIVIMVSYVALWFPIYCFNATRSFVYSYQCRTFLKLMELSSCWISK